MARTYLFLHLVDGRGLPEPYRVVLEEGAVQIHLQFWTNLLLVETRECTDPGFQHEHRHHHKDVLRKIERTRGITRRSPTALMLLLLC